MENFSLLYRIRFEHEYFSDKRCSAIACMLTEQGQQLLRRRGMIFRRLEVNEWGLFFCSEPDVDNDVLELSLQLTDREFPCYTEWKGFNPSAAYVLTLPIPPKKKKEQDATSYIEKLADVRKIGPEFCKVSIRLTKELVKNAEAGKPQTDTFYFSSPSVKWEYIFISRLEEVENGDLLLEDYAGKYEFSAFKRCEIYGKSGWCTSTKSAVPMRDTYDCQLKLVMQEKGKQAKLLLSNIEPPVWGRYKDAPGKVLRQIYYY